MLLAQCEMSWPYKDNTERKEDSLIWRPLKNEAKKD